MKLNKHGQSLVLFVVIIPFVILLLALVCDIGLITSKKVKLNAVTKDILKEVMNKDNYEELIIKLYEENDIDVDNLEITNNGKRIKNEIEVSSIFGQIIGLKKYQIKVDIEIYQENNKIKYR